MKLASHQLQLIFAAKGIQSVHVVWNSLRTLNAELFR